VPFAFVEGLGVHQDSPSGFRQIEGRKLPDEMAAEKFHGKTVFDGSEIDYTVELPGFSYCLISLA